MTVQRAAIDDQLREELTVWLSTTRPDGRPHVVPVWFTWDGSVLDLFSKPHAQKVRNVAAHPDVMLAFGEPDEEWQVELVEGTAAVLPVPTADVITEGMFEKYAALMARAALDRQLYVTTYSQPVRITPTRFLGYGGRGWTDPGPDLAGDVSGHLQAPGGSGRMPTPARRESVARIARVLRRTRRPVELLALDE